IALEALMNLSIIHRDIKLDNVMVSTQKPLCVKLIDFGLATRTSEAEQGSSFFPVCYR
uniref:Protein kinase domain-containing protein n=1 Tax=Periophthalmus magnuspinnatus TaxID=409849 RepID=A0A3B3ZUU2_9GOBI